MSANVQDDKMTREREVIEGSMFKGEVAIGS